MTELLEKAVARLRELPPHEQDEAARVMLLLVEAEPVALTPGERAAVARSRAAVERGELASEAEVEAVWAVGER